MTGLEPAFNVATHSSLTGSPEPDSPSLSSQDAVLEFVEFFSLHRPSAAASKFGSLRRIGSVIKFNGRVCEGSMVGDKDES